MAWLAKFDFDLTYASLDPEKFKHVSKLKELDGPTLASVHLTFSVNKSSLPDYSIPHDGAGGSGMNSGHTQTQTGDRQSRTTQSDHFRIQVHHTIRGYLYQYISIVTGMLRNYDTDNDLVHLIRGGGEEGGRGEGGGSAPTTKVTIEVIGCPYFNQTWSPQDVLVVATTQNVRLYRHNLHRVSSAPLRELIPRYLLNIFIVARDIVCYSISWQCHNGVKPQQRSDDPMERQMAEALKRLKARCGKPRVAGAAQHHPELPAWGSWTDIARNE